MKTASIIVPVYKIQEAYLRQCIDSLRTQTLKDIEIILIDDGSPDSCGEICDAYAREDTRIRVIHQENQGVSVARNVGLDIAQGKWLTFVDADDWLELDALERLVDAAERLDVQVLCFGGYHEWQNHREEGYMPFACEVILNEKERNQMYTYIFIAPPRMLFSVGAACGKLYRLECLRRNALKFPKDHALGEDVIFAISALLRMQRIACLDECLYHYRIRNSSADHRYREDRTAHLTKTARNLYVYLRQETVGTELWAAYYIWVYGVMQDFLSRLYGYLFRGAGRSERTRACKIFFSQHPYTEALQKMRPTKTHQKIGLFLLRRHMYGTYAILLRYWLRFRVWKSKDGKNKRCFD